MQISFNAVGENLLLGAVAETTRVAFAACSELREFAAEELLIGDGAPAGVALFPLRGSFQLSKVTLRGRRQIFCNPTPQSCGGVCLMAFGELALADIRSLTPGALLAVKRADFERLARQDPVLCQAAWRSVTSCMAHLSDLVTQLSFNKVAQRVVIALLDGTRVDGDLLRLTQSDLAAEVGTTREVVARCLAGLQAEGLIRLGRGRITVLDREKLRNQA